MYRDQFYLPLEAFKCNKSNCNWELNSSPEAASYDFSACVDWTLLFAIEHVLQMPPGIISYRSTECTQDRLQEREDWAQVIKKYRFIGRNFAIKGQGNKAHNPICQCKIVNAYTEVIQYLTRNQTDKNTGHVDCSTSCWA